MVVSLLKETRLPLPWEGLLQSAGEECPTRGAMRFLTWLWNTGPALYPHEGTGRGMGITPTSRNLFCGSREGLRPFFSRCLVGEAPGVWGMWSIVTGHSISSMPEPELGSHCQH